MAMIVSIGFTPGRSWQQRAVTDVDTRRHRPSCVEAKPAPGVGGIPMRVRPSPHGAHLVSAEQGDAVRRGAHRRSRPQVGLERLSFAPPLRRNAAGAQLDCARRMRQSAHLHQRAARRIGVGRVQAVVDHRAPTRAASNAPATPLADDRDERRPVARAIHEIGGVGDAVPREGGRCQPGMGWRRFHQESAVRRADAVRGGRSGRCGTGRSLPPGAVHATCRRPRP